MKRESIDTAVLAQLERRLSLLRDVVRSGGTDRWSHLSSHGHSYATVRSAMQAGYLNGDTPYHYQITDAGRQYLDDIDTAAILAQ